MAMTCTVCAHAERATIDEHLLNRDSLRDIARQYSVSKDALSRHKSEHIPPTLAKATEAKETALADDLLAQVKALRNKAIKILSLAESAGDFRTALLGIREARACVELLLEVEGELNRTPTVNVLIAPQWIAIRTTVLQALQPYPDARAAAAKALSEASGA